jgi:hypothetical protein
MESPRWTASDREAKLAAKASYNSNNGGLLEAIGIAYDPTGNTGKYAKHGFSASLTYSDETKTYYLAFRGTEPWLAGLPDWWANIAQGLGFRTSQHDQAIKLAQEVQSKLRNARLVLTGHSLGAGMAAAASYATGLNATVFNPASVSAVYRQGSPGAIRSHITFGDILSVGRTMSNGIPDPSLPNPHLRHAPGTVILHPPRSVNPYDPFQFHSLDQFPD